MFDPTVCDHRIAKIIDGIRYYDDDEIPDFGSIECVKRLGEKRVYQCLSDDVSKLPTRAVYPKYSDMESGSSCRTLDSGELYRYSHTRDEWVKVKIPATGSSSSGSSGSNSNIATDDEFDEFLGLTSKPSSGGSSPKPEDDYDIASDDEFDKFLGIG